VILLIDNYDSFSYNLYQMAGMINPDVRVIRNDERSVDEIRKLAPERIIISPGPGRPADAGICEELIIKMAGELPILGVCLGHQAICEAFGGKVGNARRLMHGKQSEAEVDLESLIFRGLGPEMGTSAGSVDYPRGSGFATGNGAGISVTEFGTGNSGENAPVRIKVARYHSLIAVNSQLPDCLRVTARTDEREIMAVEHRDYPVYGLQFHPESILTPQGEVMLRNFCSI